MILHSYNCFYMVSHAGQRYFAVVDDFGNLVRTTRASLNLMFQA